MRKIWLLIFVKKGFIQEPEIYYDELSVKHRKKELQMNFNPDYDGLDIFQKNIMINQRTSLN